MQATAVLGAGGTMGMGIARNLAGAGIPVRAWDRTPARLEPLQQEGATIAATPAEAAERAGTILTILSDADAVLASMQGDRGALSRMRHTTVWLQMSTIGEVATEECAALSQELGINFVDAPVLGSKQPAQEGRLVIMASGPDEPELRERLEPLFDAIGSRTLWVGQAGMGTRLKLVTNSWVLAAAEATAEIVVLAEALQVDPALFFEAIEAGPLDLPYMRTKGRAILDGDFTPSFKLSLAAKDAQLVQEAVERRDLDLPLLVTIRDRMRRAVREHGDEDVIATYWTAAERVAPGESRTRKGG